VPTHSWFWSFPGIRLLWGLGSFASEEGGFGGGVVDGSREMFDEKVDDVFDFDHADGAMFIIDDREMPVASERHFADGFGEDSPGGKGDGIVFHE